MLQSQSLANQERWRPTHNQVHQSQSRGRSQLIPMGQSLDIKSSTSVAWIQPVSCLHIFRYSRCSIIQNFKGNGKKFVIRRLCYIECIILIYSFFSSNIGILIFLSVFCQEFYKFPEVSSFSLSILWWGLSFSIFYFLSYLV